MDAADVAAGCPLKALPVAVQLRNDEIVVQVNGKIRAKLNVPANATKDDMEKIAMENETVQSHIEGKTIRKVIAVPGKLVNIVAN